MRSRFSLTIILILCVLSLSLARADGATATEISLIEKAQPARGWSFGNGAEFPGATGGLTVEPQGGHDGGPALVLKGDFSKGGNYVQAGRAVDKLYLRSLSMWVRAPGLDQLTLRLIDEGQTCHQLRLRLTPSEIWQRLRFPAAEFFATMGENKAADMVLKYEHWGKSKQAAGWQGKLTAIYLILGKKTSATPILAVSELTVASGEPPVEVAKHSGPPVLATVALDDVLQAGEVDWTFESGREFKGATGKLELVKDQPAAGQNALRLEGNFTAGGAYVQALHKLSELSGKSLDRIVFSLRTTTCHALTVRLIDGTRQCFQNKSIAVVADGQWHDVVLRPAQFAGGEHWGGANDGQWHDSARTIAIVVGKKDGEKPVIEFSKMRAQVLSAAPSAAATVYREEFEAVDCLKAWEIVGQVTLSTDRPLAGKRALQLARPLDVVNQPIYARGPKIAAHPGNWAVGLAARSELHSPDSSYRGLVAIEWLDGAGKLLEKAVAVEITGENPWKLTSKELEAPSGTSAARFRVELEKTWGKLWIDDLSLTAVEADGAEKRLERVMAMPACRGGVFLPSETPTYKVSVWAIKPLRPEELVVGATVADYWGAEQGPAQCFTLKKSGFKEQTFQYEGELTLATPSLETGRFYRLHLDVPLRGQKPFRYTIGLAKLPEAPTRKLPPESVPFTIRNWDNRIKDYFYLADRSGFRMVGVWGGWKPTPPYKPSAPGIQFTEELGMKWVTGTPGAAVERGKDEGTDPVALRTGMTNFLKENASKGLAYICLGNEPHGGPEQIAKNVAAYKALYEAVKAFDPKIKVIGTSVEPNEEYFKQGYYKYLDIYDFHTYESQTAVRKTIHEYQTLMRKYNAVKPVFSTELGLNCQGLSRMTVARDMVKKITGFFAGGGENSSWFTIMYPDPKGKLGNSSAAAFQVYDCRYNAFNPKLDAITLYNCVTGIGNKKFRAEKVYENGTETYLFANADGECLLVLWNDKARVDVGLTLPGADAARLVLIDGATVSLRPAQGVVTVTASPDPVMISYRSKTLALSDKLASAAISLAATVSVVKGKGSDLLLRGPGLTADQVSIAGPMGWKAVCRDVGPNTVTCSIGSPALSEAQAGRFVIRRQLAAAISTEVEVANTFTAALAPLPSLDGKPAGLAITLANQGKDAVKIRWQAAIESEFPMERGTFKLMFPQTPRARFGEAAEGSVNLAAGGREIVRLSFHDIDPQTLYRVLVRVSDEEGHETVFSRFMAGFAAVPKGTPTIDGDLSDDCWKKAPAFSINELRQFFPLGKKAKKWNGPDDCSAVIRYLWDEQCLYLGVNVKDDIFVGGKEGRNLWDQDGLQLLVDPRRGGGEKIGYYDYVIAYGKQGPQLWCNSTTSGDVAVGEVKQAKVAIHRAAMGGNTDYEVAIPWSCFAPFTPAVGADLGLALIVNDDDGQGRSFSGWFSGVHLKETDMLGDLILLP